MSADTQVHASPKCTYIQGTHATSAGTMARQTPRGHHNRPGSTASRQAASVSRIAGTALLLPLFAGAAGAGLLLGASASGATAVGSTVLLAALAGAAAPGQVLSGQSASSAIGRCREASWKAAEGAQAEVASRCAAVPAAPRNSSSYVLASMTAAAGGGHTQARAVACAANVAADQR